MLTTEATEATTLPLVSDTFVKNKEEEEKEKEVNPSVKYDWLCEKCKAKNFSKRDCCFKCEANKTDACELIPIPSKGESQARLKG